MHDSLALASVAEVGARRWRLRMEVLDFALVRAGHQIQAPAVVWAAASLAHPLRITSIFLTVHAILIITGFTHFYSYGDSYRMLEQKKFFFTIFGQDFSAS